MPRAEVEPVGAHRIGRPDVQVLDIGQRLGRQFQFHRLLAEAVRIEAARMIERLERENVVEGGSVQGMATPYRPVQMPEARSPAPGAPAASIQSEPASVFSPPPPRRASPWQTGLC